MFTRWKDKGPTKATSHTKDHTFREAVIKLPKDTDRQSNSETREPGAGGRRGWWPWNFRKHNPHGRLPGFAALKLKGSEFEPRRGGIFRESLHGIERQLGEIEAEHFCGLRKNVVRNGDDGAAALFRLDDVEHFTRAGPQEFGLRLRIKKRAARAHDRHGIDTGIGDAPGKYGYHRRHRGIQRV